MKILSIGNSFSTDATTYLHELALSTDLDLQVVNLYIGGCSLQTHWFNGESNTPAYSYELNGNSTGRMTSIKSALTECNWDVVTLHQASLFSGVEESYYPYFENMLAYVRKYVPNAKIFVMQTWAFENDCTREGFEEYNKNQTEMYHRLSKCYAKIADEFSLPLIKCGDLIQKLRTNYPEIPMCRDGFHMHYIYGRYALACLWLKTIFERDISKSDFYPTLPDMKTNKEYIDKIRNLISQ